MRDTERTTGTAANNHNKEGHVELRDKRDRETEKVGSVRQGLKMGEKQKVSIQGTKNGLKNIWTKPDFASRPKKTKLRRKKV